MGRRKMRLYFPLMAVLSICSLFAATQPLVAAPGGNCDLPGSLDEEIAKKYPGSRVVTLADLDEHYKDLFQKEHGSQCPGLVSVDFYGHDEPTWALVLISGDGPQRIVEFLVARKGPKAWEFLSLDKTRGTAVVWSERPGRYQNNMGREVTWAVKAVVVVRQYPTRGTIAYAWVGNKLEAAVWAGKLHGR